MGEREEVKLLGVWYSPYAIRPKIALRLKSIDYDYVEEDLFGSKSELASSQIEPVKRILQYRDARKANWFPALRVAAITKSEDTKAKAMEEVEEGLLQLEDAFVSLSKGKPFFGGEAIGYMDICFGSLVVLLKAREKFKAEKLLDETKTHSLCKWADQFLSDETVKNVVPEIDKVAEFLQDLEVRAQSAASRS
ncbi:predicted protein [Arabidopsis lyrata subsp. lyrata]|uniref:glutathione transferase n=1 Tax=Arabidopsis lyrata subsp. lyrata TaxID=81972 RepID=D7KXT1_ARALL|nr:predicted protein [Arabidopsis lyrata subsp. lyrata]